MIAIHTTGEKLYSLNSLAKNVYFRRQSSLYKKVPNWTKCKINMGFTKASVRVQHIQQCSVKDYPSAHLTSIHVFSSASKKVSC